MSMLYDTIRLHKGLYTESGRSFTQCLEARDPSDQYQGTALEGLDAFQRQLKRFDIKVKGASSDLVDKFFQTAEAAVLFPEFVARAVRQGMEEANVLPSLVAATTVIDTLDYRSITANPDKKEKDLRPVAEGAEIPATNLRLKNELTALTKRGRTLVASYEAIRFQRIDLFAVTLRQIGAQISRSQLDDAIEVLMAGNVAKTTVASLGGTAGTLTYKDLVSFWAKFDPYEMNTLLVSTDVMLQLLAIDEFKDAQAGMNFQGTGVLNSPMGARLLRTAALPAGTVIGLDHRFALELVQAGDVTVEYDKLISRQLERAAITCTTGFSRLFDEAVRVLTLQ